MRLPARWVLPSALVLALLGPGAVPGAGAEEAKPLEPKLRAELIKFARQYLQLEADPFDGREGVRGIMEKQAQAGRNMLARLEDLREVAYQGRTFDPGYRDKKWQKGDPSTEVKDGKLSVSVARGDKLRLAFSVPKKDYNEANLARVPRIEPFPTLVSLIEEKDYAGKGSPGDEVLQRKYGGEAFKELFEKWLLFAPVAVRGNYLENGNVRSLFFTAQLRDFYRRYHVDFERMVLDADATTGAVVAAAQPFLFAGLVLRRPLSGAPQIDEQSVANFAHVPVYVVSCEATQKLLLAGGAADVTLGDDAGLMAWLAKLAPRKTPSTFRWRIKTTQQVFAHWMIVGPDWNAEERSLTVERLDTKDDPNTLKLTTKGVLDLTLFLNDEIVDLDRDVRVVINGKQVLKERFERTLERVFDKQPIESRQAMYFGLLFPAMSKQIFVPEPEAPPAPAAAPSPTVPAATADEEAKAASKLKEAEEAVAAGDTERARKILEAVLKLWPASKAAEQAKDQLSKLGG